MEVKTELVLHVRTERRKVGWGGCSCILCMWHCVLIGLERALESRESIQDFSPF
jgi:hypothetical protein